MSVRRAWLVVMGVAFIANATLLAIIPELFERPRYALLIGLLGARPWAVIHAIIGVAAVHVGYRDWQDGTRQRVAHTSTTALLGFWCGGLWLATGSSHAATEAIYLTALVTLSVLVAGSDLDSHREHQEPHRRRREPAS